MRRLCTICARGGSKGLPGKNLRPFLGVPLLAHSILQAREAAIFEEIAVSSDSPEILEVASRHGPVRLVRRPDELATDEAAKIPVVRHCLEAVEAEVGQPFEVVVDLQVTSPLRLPEDIRAAVDALEASDASNVFTVTPSHHSPYFNVVELRDGRVRLAKELSAPVTRRQDGPRTFDMNGSVYVWRREVLLREDSHFLPGTAIVEMPRERSLDIDDEADFVMAEVLARRSGRT